MAASANADAVCPSPQLGNLAASLLTSTQGLLNNHLNSQSAADQQEARSQRAAHAGVCRGAGAAAGPRPHVCAQRRVCSAADTR